LVTFQQDGLLVSKCNRPAAWIVSAERLAQVAAARRGEAADTYRRVLELIAVELYREAILTPGQGAKLAGMSLVDCSDLRAHLHVPILWETEE
jgi:Uncharacterised protein family (UPF0175)